MTKDKIYLFDTTLRDGAQTQGVDFSIDDKVKGKLGKKGEIVETLIITSDFFN